MALVLPKMLRSFIVILAIGSSIALPKPSQAQAEAQEALSMEPAIEAFIRELQPLSAVRSKLYAKGTPLSYDADSADARAWGLLAEMIRKFTVGGNSPDEVPGLHMVIPFQPADWNNAETGDYRLMRVLADSIPRWHERYLPRNLSFSETYGLFVESLRLPAVNEDKAKEARAHLRALGRLAVKYLKHRTSALQDWQEFDRAQRSLPPNQRLTFEQWWRGFGRYYVEDIQAEMTERRFKYVRAHNEAYRGYRNIANSIDMYYSTETDVRRDVLTPSGELESVYVYNVTPDLRSFVADGKRNAAGDVFAFAEEVTSVSTAYDYSREWRSGGLSFSGAFVRFGASGSSETIAIDSKWDKFRMAFNAHNAAWFTVTPGPWFSGRTILDFENGPFIDKSWAAEKDSANELYGPNGDYNLMAIQFLVAYQPSLSVTVDAGEYNEIRQKYRIRGGMRIGPFRIGGSGGGESVDINFDNETGTIEMTHIGEEPVIVAVRSAVLPKLQ